MDQIQEIKSRLDIVEVVREYLPNLKQSGSNWKALCPFHSEKTPSFMVSSEKQIWHCFGCGEGGDVFEFVKKIENVEFGEALRILADKAGVVLKKQDPKLIDKRSRLLELMVVATKFFQAHLWQTNNGAQALEYLRNRGLKDDTLKEWKLGYAPVKPELLIDFLQKQGYTHLEMEEAGLIIDKGRGNFFNRFTDRVMFPLFNEKGQVVGFTGRLLKDKEGQGKYVNSPQTILYNKSYVLYGLFQAKDSLKQKHEAVVVEGQMDVLTAHQAGFRNTVASSGTALTEFQLDLLKRYADKIIFAFDADQAGRQAVEKATDLALRKGFEIKVAVLPSGRDPDDFIRSSPEQWLSLIAEAPAVMDYFFTIETTDINIDDIKAKKQAAYKLVKIIKKMPDPIDQDFYIKKLSEKLNIDEAVVRGMVASGTDLPSKAQSNAPHKTSLPVRQQTSRRFLAWLIGRYDFWQEAINEILPEMLEADLERELYNHLVVYYNNNHSVWGPEIISTDRLEQIFSNKPTLSNLFAALSLLAQDLTANITDPYSRDDFRLLERNLKDGFYRKKLSLLKQELAQAEQAGRSDEVERLTAAISQVLSQLSQISNID